MLKRKRWAKAVRRARNQAEYDEGAAPTVGCLSEVEEPSGRCEDETNKRMRIMKKRHYPLDTIVSCRCCHRYGKDADKHKYDENSSSTYGSSSSPSHQSTQFFSSSDGRRKKAGKRIKNNMRAANDLTLTNMRPYREVCRKGRRGRKGFSKSTQCGINIVTAVGIKLSIAILLATLL